jgi:DNA-binding transcriptional MocR family regulator
MSDPIQYQIQGSSCSQIASSLEAAIRQGRLAPAASLPTIRGLAARLRVSPTTVAAAYRALQARGLLSARGRRGTRVAFRPPLSVQAPTLPVTGGAPPRPGRGRDLSDGNPDAALLPRLAPFLARLDARPRLYGEPTRHPELLSIAARQLAADGVPTAHLAIVGGALDGIERVLQAHLRPGDRVAVEDPGYTGVLDLVPVLGLVAEPMALDDSGPLPEALQRALRAGARAVILTPRAQNPTGAALDPARLRGLGRVLDGHPETLLVEDDHAGLVAGAPGLSLSSRHRGPWAVVRSVSKSLGPDLRLAFLAGDATSVARVEGRQRLGSGWVSHVLQGLVARLLAAPPTRRLLSEASRRYAERREALLASLAAGGIPAQGRSGLNVWVPVPEEGRTLQRLAELGWRLQGGERYRLKSPPALRITTAGLSPADAPRLARDLARSLAPQATSRPA